MKRPKLLDLFCGAGGCAVGYHRAGFDVIGVDHRPQPSYPFPFLQADALTYLRNLIEGDHDSCGVHAEGIDAIHASPPCQVFSAAKRIGNCKATHQDLLAKTRNLLLRTGAPWVIENVPGAPLLNPITLCGSQFGLPLRRHRLFESSLFLMDCPNPCRHATGDKTIFGKVVQLCGSRGAPYLDARGRTHYRQKRVGLKYGQEAMGIDWMNRAELSQAIPPAYTEFVGRQLLNIIGG